SGKQRRLRKAEKRNEHAGNANPFHGAKHYETRGPLSSAISFKVLSSHFHQSETFDPDTSTLSRKRGDTCFYGGRGSEQFFYWSWHWLCLCYSMARHWLSLIPLR